MCLSAQTVADRSEKVQSGTVRLAISSPVICFVIFMVLIVPPPHRNHPAVQKDTSRNHVPCWHCWYCLFVWRQARRQTDGGHHRSVFRQTVSNSECKQWRAVSNRMSCGAVDALASKSRQSASVCQSPLCCGCHWLSASGINCLAPHTATTHHPAPLPVRQLCSLAYQSNWINQSVNLLTANHTG